MDTDQGNGVDQAPADQQPHKPRRVVLPSVFIAMCALLVVAAGFVAFWEKSAQMKWQDNVTGDGIVVLTGGPERISTAIDLLKRKAAGRLLISGVNPRTTALQLGRIMGVRHELFKCCIDLDKRAADTRGNATQAALWAAERKFAKLLIVTSDYHILRAMKEFSKAMPDVELVPCPVSGRDGRQPWSNLSSLKLWFNEYVKYLLALLRIGTGN
jgi:uncharacterized SAM-binding protein YcdF (DUF218 family)